jgi:hypothetical protein
MLTLTDVRNAFLRRLDDLIRHGESDGVDVTTLRNARIFIEQATTKQEMMHMADVIEAFAKALPDD